MANIALNQPQRPSIGRVLSVGFVVLVALGLLGLLLWGMVSSSKPSGAVAIQPRAAQPFTLAMYDGSSLRLDDLRGKVVVINFWASWCVPCQDEAATLQQMALKYQEQGVVFLGVNVWDKDADARAFLSRNGVSYPNGVDPKGAIAIDYGVAGVPESYFIDRNGMVVRKWIGPMTDRQISAWLNELVKPAQ